VLLWFNDLRYAARSLTNSPILSFAVIILLSLGIGLNAVLFSVADAILLHPLSYPEPDRLVILHWEQYPKRAQGDISANAYFQVRKQAHSLAEVAALYPLQVGVDLSSNGRSTYSTALSVSSDFFVVLQAKPMFGQDLSSEGQLPQAAAVLSYNTWVRDMDKSPNILGKIIRVNGVIYHVAGVMPEGFRSFPNADVWLSLKLDASSANLGNDYRVIARVRDGYSLEQVRQELRSISEREQLGFSSSLHSLLSCEPLLDYISRDVKPGLMVLFAAAVVVLLVACLNVAMLVTVRSIARTQEVAIRVALGSPRYRIVRIFFLESVLHAIAGGIFGAILAKESLRYVVYYLPAALQSGAPIRMNLTVLVFAALISALTALIFGIGPAFKISRTDVNELLKNASQAIPASHGHKVAGRFLVAGQAALTMVLLNTFFLLLHSFLQLHSISPGFNPNHVWVEQVLFYGERGRSPEMNSQLIEELLAKIRGAPGVESASSTTSLPLEKGLNLPVYPGSSLQATEHGAEYQIVSPGYFRTLSIAVLEGRDFTQKDESSSKPVAIVNQTLANQWWPGRTAVGQFTNVSPEAGPQLADQPREVIGVVADIRSSGLDRPPAPTVFIPVRQASQGLLTFVNRIFLTSIIVRTNRGAEILKIFQSIAPGENMGFALAGSRPLNAVLASSLQRPRFYAMLTSVFSSLALILTVIGVYGVVKYHSGMRARELGLRMVLGANRRMLVALLTIQGLKPVLYGTAIGMAGAFAGENLLRVLLYNFTRQPIAVIFISAALFVGATALTCYISGLRVVLIEPGDLFKAE
jgi:predicted permease